jgi:putative FmdB family regulatory protein
MPIFDYSCLSCSHRFEALVLRNATPSCPECKSQDLERLLSIPRVKSESTHNLAMQAAKRRDKSQAQEKDHAQRQYEASHDD